MSKVTEMYLHSLHWCTMVGWQLAWFWWLRNAEQSTHRDMNTGYTPDNTCCPLKQHSQGKRTKQKLAHIPGCPTCLWYSCQVAIDSYNRHAYIKNGDGSRIVYLYLYTSLYHYIPEHTTYCTSVFQSVTVVLHSLLHMCGMDCILYYGCIGSALIIVWVVYLLALGKQLIPESYTVCVCVFCGLCSASQGNRLNRWLLGWNGSLTMFCGTCWVSESW